MSYLIDNAESIKNSEFKMAVQTPDMLVTQHVYKIAANFQQLFPSV